MSEENQHDESRNGQEAVVEQQDNGISTDRALRIISASDVELIHEVAKGFGAAELDTDRDGDPRIIGMIEGIRYTILFYGCEDGNGCKDIQFRAGWSDTEVTMADLNTWNRTKRFGNAYLDGDNDPILDMSVNLNFGVTRRNLEDTFDWWSVVIQMFRTEVINKERPRTLNA